MPLKSLPADEHVPCELGFSTVLLEMTLRDCRWQNIIYVDSCSSLLQQCPRKCIFQPNICMKYDNRDRAWRQLKHLHVFYSFGVCIVAACRYQGRAWLWVLGPGWFLLQRAVGGIQLLNGMSFGDGGEGGDEVSSTRSWPPPHRNRRAVTTSGFSVPACANDMLDAGLALSLSPDNMCCAPLAALNTGTVQSRDREVWIRVSAALV